MFPNLVCKLCIINNVPFDTHRCGIGQEGGRAINKLCRIIMYIT